MLKKKRKKKKKIRAIQKLSKFYTLDELDNYYSVVFQRLTSMKNHVSDAFFFILLHEHERRMKKDLKLLRKVERREFNTTKRLYREDQKSGKITPYEPIKESPVAPAEFDLKALNKCLEYLESAKKAPKNLNSTENMEISPVLPSGDAGNLRSKPE